MIPRILVIDDLFGSFFRDRRNLCRNFGLIDVTGEDDTPISLPDPVAEVVFCPGQIRHPSFVTNDIPTVVEMTGKGWNTDISERWALVLLDLRFASGKIGKDGEPEGQPEDDTFGLQILKAIETEFPDLPVVIISARERAEVIEDCRKLGALDFIQRHEYGADAPTPRDTLRAKIHEHGLIPDYRGIIIGHSIPLLKALRSARRAATGKGNILLIGETGTGKELHARYTHALSPKGEGPYVVFHPFGTAETLQEDELFGHMKGAFTGAVSDREGLFERANGGTLLIDEVGDIPDGLQKKLLRPLESRVTTRQGGNKEFSIDLQVVLATNKDLEEFTKTGKFKSDLLNRINAYSITIPPLRERKEDIPVIAERLLELLCKENNARWPRKILPDAMELLRNHNWPDNVRGLRNILERAVKNNRDSEIIVSSDIGLDVQGERRTCAVTESSKEKPDGVINEIINHLANIEFPLDYSKLHGKFPALQEAVTRMFSNYLSASIEVTKKKKPGGSSEGEVNLTGAVSCMMGTQLRTPQAADIIKKILQSNKKTLADLMKNKPLLNKVYDEVLRLRPKKPK